MPARSNEFQRLIYLIHSQLHSNALVTESKMLEDSLGGPEQEVDVVIEEKSGPYSVRIVVECIDRRRRADIGWVQQMWGKHRARADKVVLVSKSGFTKNALREAGVRRITALTLSEENSIDSDPIIEEIKMEVFQLFTFRITDRCLWLRHNNEPYFRHDVDPNENIYINNTSINLGNMTQSRITSHSIGTGLMDIFYKNIPLEYVTAQEDVPDGSYYINRNGERFEVKYLEFTITYQMSENKMSPRYGVFAGVPVVWGEAVTHDGRLLLVSTKQHGVIRTSLYLNKTGSERRPHTSRPD
jgi:hypothetical protein